MLLVLQKKFIAFTNPMQLNKRWTKILSTGTFKFLTSGSKTVTVMVGFVLMASGPCLCCFQHTAIITMATIIPNTTQGMTVYKRFDKCPLSDSASIQTERKPGIK